MQKFKNFLNKTWNEPTKNQKILIYLFYCVITFAVMSVFYYRQALYGWDLPVHIAKILDTSENEAYSLVSYLLLLSYKITNSVVGCAIFLAICQVLSYFSAAYFFLHLLKYSDNKLNLSFFQCFVISAPLLYIGSLYIPLISPGFYKQAFITQPYHNGTYLLMRLTGFLVLGLYLKIRTDYLENGISLKHWLLFFVLLTLTNAFKPNFIMFFAPAMLFELIYDFIKTRGKKTMVIVEFGFAVLLSLPVLLLQFNVLFNNEHTAEEASGIIIGFKRFFESATLQSVAAHIFGSLLFIIIVSIICIMKKCISRNLIFGWLMFLVAYAERSFIYETGPRANDGNFIWGIFFATLLLAIICFERLLFLKDQIKKSTFIFLIILLILMIVCGVMYFGAVLIYNSPLF